MNQIIVASHGNLAAGMADTVEMILGHCSNVHAVSMLRDQPEQIGEQVIKIIDTFSESDEIFLLTDILNGSVNNELIPLLSGYINLNLISGMNLALVIGLATSTNSLNKDELDNILAQSRLSIVNCRDLIENLEGEEDDLL